jgi:two-component sensor histidine kinase
MVSDAPNRKPCERAPIEELVMHDTGLARDAVIVAPDLASGLVEQSDDWEVIVRETHHRMKNTLTLLTAWLRLDLAHGGPSKFPRSVDRFEDRVLAFGRLYHVLSNGADSKQTSVADYFEELCGALSAAILEPSGLRCEAAIEGGLLGSEQCHRLGLIVTELVTNAAKHAFPNRKAGLIRVEANYQDGSWHCTVADNGVGATAAPQGAGGRILRALAHSIGAELIMQSSRFGTAVTVVMPAIQ